MHVSGWERVLTLVSEIDGCVVMLLAGKRVACGSKRRCVEESRALEEKLGIF